MNKNSKWNWMECVHTTHANGNGQVCFIYTCIVKQINLFTWVSVVVHINGKTIRITYFERINVYTVHAYVYFFLRKKHCFWTHKPPELIPFRLFVGNKFYIFLRNDRIEKSINLQLECVFFAICIFNTFLFYYTHKIERFNFSAHIACKML